MSTANARIVESDAFAFEFLSGLAERESWRKEIHRPVYHIHKWWAQRLGSVFRGLLLGSILPDGTDLTTAFYKQYSLDALTVFDPFMGSGTTLGEAHKLGMTALGRDINPVATRAVRTALGPLDSRHILAAYEELAERIEQQIRNLYRSIDSRGRTYEVLYYFWVMQAVCPNCSTTLDLFSSYIVARNAHPDRKSHVQVRCPACTNIFQIKKTPEDVTCTTCHHRFDATKGIAAGAKATCTACRSTFSIIKSISDARPNFRLFGKLVLFSDGRKEYLPATNEDLTAFLKCRCMLEAEVEAGRLSLPTLCLMAGHNTRQAMNYHFDRWADFFNDRQLLALCWLRQAILELSDAAARDALLTLFSATLEFNNLFASYKGEGTGAVRHMFSHHILKPERTPIEANVWGTQKSSGGFSNLLRSRLLRAINYRHAPTELNGSSLPAKVCSPSFTGRVEPNWPTEGEFAPRGIYVSSGDSARTGLPDKSIDLIATDPPFFDNVHYSELADFFYAWQQLDTAEKGCVDGSTRQEGEVQDVDADRFAAKLLSVFAECHRVLRDDGLLVFTYHHSRQEGWESLAHAVWGAGFAFVNSHPVKAEMSVATPKFQAKEPIQLDIIIVCRKQIPHNSAAHSDPRDALERARAKLHRLANAGFSLSRNDRRITLVGQLLASIEPGESLSSFDSLVDQALDDETFSPAPVVHLPAQLSLF